ncbi:HGR023Cp [Eremothecium sinecaudum]|uniref:Ubiquitin carboxyl-terminal hydrolase n=1 Tax=Eremothecium sinecaudum TaxID=45286 RepID=A0A0X8HVR6_9SACH|nr:HGR023Cp [Eremothecium sinecaudum]AMD22362.1 HGR023Cp [Eremothecium sinecaudum]
MHSTELLQFVKDVDIPSTIYKDDCGYCFKTMVNHSSRDDHEAAPENQLNICLLCFQGFCRDHVNFHQRVVQNSLQTVHDVYLNAYKLEKSQTSEQSQEKKLKLEVQDLSDDELYEYHWSLLNYHDGTLETVMMSSEKDKHDQSVVNKLEQIIRAKSAGYQEMKTTWQLDILPCSHTNDFVIPDIEKEVEKTCNKCDLDNNLWLCLHCGHIGCGREQVGIQGSSHALAHYEETSNSHPLAIKLGSLSRDSSDVYCYACDDDVRFGDKNQLALILASYGITLDDQVAKERTLLELQVEQNMSWDFKMEDANGQSFRSLEASKSYGCGLINLGNSCYMNSVLQILLNGGVRDWDLEVLGETPLDVVYPSKNLKCQLIKLREAFKSSPEKYKHGVKPTSVKQCIGSGNEEFGSARQQDAMEFLTYFIDKLDKNVFNEGTENPNDKVRFIMDDRVQCTECNRVKYRENVAEALQLPLLQNEEPQDLIERIDAYMSGEPVNMKCSYCKKETVVIKSSKFKSAPSTLVINPIRMRLQNWTPIKTNNKLLVPGVEDDNILDISAYKSSGIQSDEIEFPDDDDNDEYSGFHPVEEYISSIVDMGFTRNAAVRSLYYTGNSNAETALNWIFEHIEDPELNSEFVIPGSNSKGRVDPDALSNMIAMGLAEKLSRKALLLNNNDLTRSVEWVFNNLDDDGELEEEVNGPSTATPPRYGSYEEFPIYQLSAVICHKGNSIHSGHYVAFIKKPIKNKLCWVLYNDEKIVEANSEENLQEIEKNGYIYIFNST